MENLSHLSNKLNQISITKSSNEKNKIKYLYELPFDVRRLLTDLLDADKTWRELGGNYMNLSEIELELISYAILRKESPTNTMLIKWEQSNVTINHLYKCLAKMKHLRAMSLLKNFIDKSLYSLYDEKMFESNSNYKNKKFSNKNLNCIPNNDNKNQKEICIKNKLIHITNDSQQNDVKKKIQISDMQSNFRDNYYTKASTINAHDDNLKYEELLNATNNFHSSNIIGSGGFGIVYKGFWKGTKVAIKRLKDTGNFHQALIELQLLNQYRIDNIVPIYGISLDGPEPCLIYQFMVNGSLDDRLQCKKNTLPLTWLQRINIGFGIAKALNYLHTRKGNPLIHGDVKSANILLDAQLQPKLGDFGLAKYFQESQSKSSNENNSNLSKINIKNLTHMTVTSVHGTVAYLPPEYLRCKIHSPAVDVYSYGILLLEMLTGLRAYDGKSLLIDLITIKVEENLSKISKSCQILGELSNQIKISNKKQTESNQNTFINNNSCSCLNCCLYEFQDKKLPKNLQNLFWFHCILKLSLDCCNKLKKKRPDFSLVLKMYNLFFDQWQQFNLFNEVFQITNLNITKIDQYDDKKKILTYKLSNDLLNKKTNASAPPMQTSSETIISTNQTTNHSNKKLSNNLDKFNLSLKNNLTLSNNLENVLNLQNDHYDQTNYTNKRVENYEIPLLTELGINKKT